MDYSLVCGVSGYTLLNFCNYLPPYQVDSQNNELVIGIVGKCTEALAYDMALTLNTQIISEHTLGTKN